MNAGVTTLAKLKNWNPDDWKGEVIKQRPYPNRREYEENQKAAFVKRQKAIRRFDEDVKRFKANFETLEPLIVNRNSLCLGARSGAEVKAMRMFANRAIGIDIAPVDERYVQKGDFHSLKFDDKSFDIVYTNSFDHVYDLQTALSEVHRVLKDDGRFILEMVAGFEEGGCPGDHEAMYWRTAKDFSDEVETRGFKLIMPLQSVPYCKGLPFTRGVYEKT